MKRLTIYSVIAAASVASCTPAPMQEEAEFQASFELPAALKENDLLLRWTAEDRVSLFNKITYNQPYEFTGKAGNQVIGFQKIDKDEFITGNPITHVVSVSPYQEKTRIDESEVLSINLPAEQPYAENTFAFGANTMVSVSSDNVLRYKNVGGYLKLNLYGGVKVSSITLKGNNKEKLAGKASVTIPLDGNPSTEMAEDATMEITLVCATPVQLGATAEDATPFWFVVPPMTFEKGFTITITGDDGEYLKSTEESLTINRNSLSQISPMEVGSDDLNINIPFEDAGFKYICVFLYDTNGDKEISLEEAREVEKIDIYQCPIRILSLRGIEYFCNLTDLNCSGLYLTSLDVSKNTALKKLFCFSNRLTSLDVSNNASLESLDCSRNSLSSLDVSNNPALRFLGCGSNQLSCLDLSKNPALKSLECEDNQLTGLDLRGKTELDYLSCGSNLLTDLDLSECPALGDVYCNNNQITGLNVSGCKALGYMYCEKNQLTSLDLSECPALSCLDCNDNQLSNLDLSKNTALFLLRCENNQLVHLDVSGSKELYLLKCSKNQLVNLDVSDKPALDEIYCNDNRLTSLDVSGCLVLRCLYCNDNQLSSLDVSECPRLKVLWCYNNPSLLEIWLKNGQGISGLKYDEDIATIKYKP